MRIGFSGKKGSGKDTAVQIVSQILIRPTQNVAFAKPLKDLADHYCDVDRTLSDAAKKSKVVRLDESGQAFLAELVPGRDVSDVHQAIKRLFDEPLTYGLFLQKLGTDIVRDMLGVNFWVDLMVARTSNPDVIYLISDVRFPNELVICDYCFRINCDMKTIIERRAYDGRDPKHASETSLDGHDFGAFTVDNNGTLDNLTSQLIVGVARIIKKE